MNVGSARLLADREIFIDMSQGFAAICAGLFGRVCRHGAGPEKRYAAPRRFIRAPTRTPAPLRTGLTKWSQRGVTASAIASNIPTSPARTFGASGFRFSAEKQ